VFIVCSGVVSCRVGDVEVRQFSAGQSFGDMSIFCDHMYRVHEEHESILGDAGALCNLLTRSADIFGLEMGALMELSSRDLASFFVICPRLVHNVVRVGEQQLAEACDNQSDQALEARKVIAALHPLVTAGFLKGVPDNLAKSILDSVSVLDVRVVRRTESLLSQGSQGDSVFLIMSGLFSCQVNGKEVRHFGPWQIFGEVSLCAASRSWCTRAFRRAPTTTGCRRRWRRAASAPPMWCAWRTGG